MPASICAYCRVLVQKNANAILFQSYIKRVHFTLLSEDSASDLGISIHYFKSQCVLGQDTIPKLALVPVYIGRVCVDECELVRGALL